jgi:hypothetical protein
MSVAAQGCLFCCFAADSPRQASQRTERGGSADSLVAVLAPLVLVIVAVVVWKLWAPAMGWVPAFARLLERPVTGTGVLPFVMGLETAGGDFQGRPVLLALHHKRGRHSLGYLVVAMQPRTTAPLAAEALASVTTPAAREALDALEGRDGLHVSFDDGWLKARWHPGGFLVFPGRFEPHRWRRVLQAMSVVTGSLESAG